MRNGNLEPFDQRLTPEQFRALVKYKGWSYVSIAARWDCTADWVSKIARNQNRPIRYDDLIHGLPNLNRAAQDKSRRAQRVSIAMGQFPKKIAQPEAVVTPGYRYRDYLVVGSIVTASAAVGSMAEEGERGIVFQVIDRDNQESYGIIFETGLWDWFAPDHIDTMIAGTGLNSENAGQYLYTDEVQLQKDFVMGLFEFWQKAD